MQIAYKKLYSNERVVSATDVFSRVQAPIEQGGGYNLTTKVAQKRWNDVWIVPHIVDDTREGIYKKLKADDKLVDRLWAMMDLDRIVVADEEPEKKNEEVKGAPLPAASSASASTSTSSSPQASGEHSPPHRPRPVHPDPVLVEVFMAQLPGSTIEQAEAALIKSGNDLVEALTLGVPNAEIDAMEAGMMKTVGAQLEGQSFTKKGQESAAPATAQESAAAEQPVPAPADGLSEEERRKLVRAKTVYECIFKLQYAGYYMVAKPRDADAGPIQDNEVITKFCTLVTTMLSHSLCYHLIASLMYLFFALVFQLFAYIISIYSHIITHSLNHRRP